ncbi:hypothetical protein [Streptomyces geranii]|uniref:hypothetical protein n=1 Tax=Streptomyces geranii TaxID=2058923 RepID=UPI00130073C4|nr:hypothetical protein [Streptomyces geranii]
MLLPLVDEEAWRRGRRRERLGNWGVDIGEGERLIEILAALTAYAVVVDIAGSAASAAVLDTLPLGVVAEAATGKRDFELLAGLPDAFADGRDELAVKVFRLYVYRGERYSLRLWRMATELQYALTVLGGRSRVASPGCGHVFFWAAAAGLAGGAGVGAAV